MSTTVSAAETVKEPDSRSMSSGCGAVISMVEGMLPMACSVKSASSYFFSTGLINSMERTDRAPSVSTFQSRICSPCSRVSDWPAGRAMRRRGTLACNSS